MRKTCPLEETIDIDNICVKKVSIVSVCVVVFYHDILTQVEYISDIRKCNTNIFFFSSEKEKVFNAITITQISVFTRVT